MRRPGDEEMGMKMRRQVPFQEPFQSKIRDRLVFNIVLEEGQARLSSLQKNLLDAVSKLRKQLRAFCLFTLRATCHVPLNNLLYLEVVCPKTQDVTLVCCAFAV